MVGNWLGAVAEQEGSDGPYLVYSWDIADNWIDGAVPNIQTTIEIAPGAPGPVLQNAAAVDIMTVDAGATVTLGAPTNAADTAYGAGRLTVSGNVFLDGVLSVDAAAVDGASGSSLTQLHGLAQISSTGSLVIGNDLEAGVALNSRSTVRFDDLVNAGAITIDEGPYGDALDVATVAGFGQVGALTGDVTLNGVGAGGTALFDFLRGGVISSIAAGASLTLDGAHAFLASGTATGSNSALAGLSALDGELRLLDGAKAFVSGPVAIGDGADAATLDLDTGALLESGRLTVNANATLEIGATSSTNVNAPIVIDGGTVALGTGAELFRSIAFTDAGGTLDLANQTQNAVSGLNGTVNLTNSRVTLAGDDYTVNVGSGRNWVGLEGDDDTVNATGGQIGLIDAAATIVGALNTIYFESGKNTATLLGSNQTWDTVFGSGGEVDLTSGYADVVGGDDTVNLLGTGDVLRIRKTGGLADTIAADGQQINFQGAQAEIDGGGDKVFFVSGAGNVASLVDTDGVFDIVTGSGGEVDLASAQATVHGGGDTIVFARGTGVSALIGDMVVLYQTSGVADTVDGSNGEIFVVGSQAVIVGGDDSVRLSGSGDVVTLEDTQGAADTVWASNSEIALAGAQATIDGGDDAVNFSGAGVVITLTDAQARADAVSGSNGDITLLSADASITGGGDSIVSYDPQNISLFSTNGADDTVTGSDEILSLTSAGATIIGRSDTIYQDDGVSNIWLEGTQGIRDRVINYTPALDVAYIGSGQVNLDGAQADVMGYNATVNFVGGSGNLVELTVYVGENLDFGLSGTVDGSNGTIVVDSGSSSTGVVTVNGNDDNITQGVLDSVTVNGGGDRISWDGENDDSLFLSATNGTWDYVDDYAVVYSSGGGQVTLTDAQAFVQGYNAIVNLVGSGSSVALTPYTLNNEPYGPSATVNGSNSRIVLEFGYDDLVGGVVGHDTINGGDDYIVDNGDFVALNGNSETVDLSQQSLTQAPYAVFANIAGFNATDVVVISSQLIPDWQTLQADMTQMDDNTVIIAYAGPNNDFGSSITLANVQKSSLTQNEFKFV